jgi:ELWxxDGT repeat protein
MLTNIPRGANPVFLTNINGRLFFNATDNAGLGQLWISNGTAAGTTMLTNVSIGGGADPIALTNANGTLFFTANDGTHAEQLWISNGAIAGTTMVTDINPVEPFGFDPFNMTSVNSGVNASALLSPRKSVATSDSLSTSVPAALSTDLAAVLGASAGNARLMSSSAENGHEHADGPNPASRPPIAVIDAFFAGTRHKTSPAPHGLMHALSSDDDWLTSPL